MRPLSAFWTKLKSPEVCEVAVDTLGVVEVNSIAAGVELADGMVKVADVELVRAATLCSGRFIIHVAGDREAVETSVNFARAGQKRLSGSFVISNVSPLLIAALKKSEPAMPGEALGVVESRFVSMGINAADIAVKKSEVRLLKFVPVRVLPVNPFSFSAAMWPPCAKPSPPRANRWATNWWKRWLSPTPPKPWQGL